MGVSLTAPLLLRAARGEQVDRPPVWMMRQAGRYMKAYRDLRDKYPSFRDRSEIPEVAIEVSLQPWRAFQHDGVRDRLFIRPYALNNKLINCIP